MLIADIDAITLIFRYAMLMPLLMLSPDISCFCFPATLTLSFAMLRCFLRHYLLPLRRFRRCLSPDVELPP